MSTNTLNEVNLEIAKAHYAAAGWKLHQDLSEHEFINLDTVYLVDYVTENVFIVSVPRDSLVGSSSESIDGDEVRKVIEDEIDRMLLGGKYAAELHDQSDYLDFLLNEQFVSAVKQLIRYNTASKNPFNEVDANRKFHFIVNMHCLDAAEDSDTTVSVFHAFITNHDKSIMDKDALLTTSTMLMLKAFKEGGFEGADISDLHLFESETTLLDDIDKMNAGHHIIYIVDHRTERVEAIPFDRSDIECFANDDISAQEMSTCFLSELGRAYRHASTKQNDPTLFEEEVDPDFDDIMDNAMLFARKFISKTLSYQRVRDNVSMSENIHTILDISQSLLDKDSVTMVSSSIPYADEVIPPQELVKISHGLIADARCKKTRVLLGISKQG